MPMVNIRLSPKVCDKPLARRQVPLVLQLLQGLAQRDAGDAEACCEMRFSGQLAAWTAKLFQQDRRQD